MNFDDTAKIGHVTPEERDEIQKLYEHKNGLSELAKSLSSLSKEDLEEGHLYKKIIEDMGKTEVSFQRWWDEKAACYGWPNVSGCFWEIDFATGDIYLKNRQSR
jgi:CXXX repeat modification system protein